MKSDYNKYEKNDLPFDTYTDFPIQSFNYNENQKGDEKNLKKKEKKLKREKKLHQEEQKQANKIDKISEQEPKFKERLRSSSYDLDDLEELNEQNLRYYRSRTRRNRMIIITLVVLLLAVIIGITLYLNMIYLQNNCFLYTHGDCNASYIVDDNEMKRFRTPNNLQGNRVLRADFDIKLESKGEFMVKFRIDVFQSDELMDNIIIYYPNRDLFYNWHDGYYYSKEPISGGKVIDLCQGVVLDIAYENTLNVDNFRLEFHTYFERV